MRKNIIKISIILTYFINCLLAQEYNQPLTMQGLNHTTNHSVISIGMGGVSLLKNDVSVMFSNPAALQSLEGIQVSVGGLLQYKTNEQVQHWFVNWNYSNLSLLMEGLTDQIPDPVIDPSVPFPTAKDSVPRPFDDLKPNWKNRKDEKLPLQFFAALPVKVNNVKMVVGLGAVEYANLNRYYENRNVLSPDIGSLRKNVFYIPATDADNLALPVYWLRSISYRSGSIYGYGGTVSIGLLDKFAFGVSLLTLDGTTREYEYLTGRGLLIFHRTYFGLYPYNDKNFYKTNGISEYSGTEFTLSASYRLKNANFGITAKPVNTIKRDYKYIATIDSAGSIIQSQEVNGKDEMFLPCRGSLELNIDIKENLAVAIMYEIMPYSKAIYVDSKSGSTSKPWLDIYKFGIGFEYSPLKWLLLRGGYSKQTDVFSPEGDYFTIDPVPFETYSLGTGFKYSGFQVNLAYQYTRLKYVDKWATNVNTNTESLQNIVATVSYTLK